MRTIDLDHASAQLRRHPPRPVGAACLDIGCQPVGRVIGKGDGFFFGIKRHHRHHRAKDFLTHDGHVRTRIGKDGRPCEPSAIQAFRPANAASNKARAFINTGLDQPLHLVELRL